MAKQAVQKQQSEELVPIEADPRLDGFRRAAAKMYADAATTDGFDIVAQIMTAETLEDILGPGVVHLKDNLNKPFTIESAVLQKSDFADGLQVYLVMHIAFDPDLRGDIEKAVMTTGSNTVLAQVVRAQELGFIPGFRCQGKESDKPTEAGYYPLRLVGAPKLEESF